MWRVKQQKQKKKIFVLIFFFFFCPEETAWRQDTRSLTQVGSKQPEQERTGTVALQPPTQEG